MVNINQLILVYRKIASPRCGHYRERSLFVIRWRQALFLYYSELPFCFSHFLKVLSSVNVLHWCNYFWYCRYCIYCYWFFLGFVLQHAQNWVIVYWLFAQRNYSCKYCYLSLYDNYGRCRSKPISDFGYCGSLFFYHT